MNTVCENDLLSSKINPAGLSITSMKNKNNHTILFLSSIIILVFFISCLGTLNFRILNPITFYMENYQSFTTGNVEIQLPDDWQLSETSEEDEQEGGSPVMDTLLSGDIPLLDNQTDTTEEASNQGEEEEEETKEDEEEEEIKYYSILLQFNNPEGTTLGKLYLYEYGDEQQSLYEKFMDYLAYLGNFHLHDFRYIVPGNVDEAGSEEDYYNAQSYLAKAFYRREFPIFYAAYRNVELNKLFLLKILCMDPKMEIDDTILGIFFQSKVADETDQRSAMKFGIRVVGRDGWFFQDASKDEVFKLYYPTGSTLITLHYLKRFSRAEDPSDIIQEEIQNYKDSKADFNYTFKTTLETITPQNVSAIRLKVENIYTQNEIEIAALKYFFAYNNRIFELVVIYPKEDINEELEEEIQAIIDSIQFA